MTAFELVLEKVHLFSFRSFFIICVYAKYAFIRIEKYKITFIFNDKRFF